MRFYRIYQWITRGFSDYSLASLDNEICKWLKPRLERFIEISLPIGYKETLDLPRTVENEALQSKAWEDILNDILYYVTKVAEEDGDWSNEDERFAHGKKMFFEHFEGLWY